MIGLNRLNIDEEAVVAKIGEKAGGSRIWDSSRERK